MNWAYNILVSLDQLANTVIGGNCDCTISGHIGLKALTDTRFKRLESIVDFTFKPIETNHCQSTYLDENDTDDADNFILTTIVVIIGCLFLIPIIRICGVFYKHIGYFRRI